MTTERPRRVLSSLALSLILAAATLGAPACKSPESEPVAVARAFANAARRSDVNAMMAVLERPAVERLELAAEQASDQVGGRRNIETSEMLQIVGVDRTEAVSHAELIDQSESLAHVELTTTSGRTVHLELVFEAAPEGSEGAGEWKVRLPPAKASAADLEAPLLPPT